MEKKKSAAQIYYEMIEHCEKRTLEYLKQLVIEKTYEESIKKKKVKVIAKGIISDNHRSN